VQPRKVGVKISLQKKKKRRKDKILKTRNSKQASNMGRLLLWKGLTLGGKKFWSIEKRPTDSESWVLGKKAQAKETGTLKCVLAPTALGGEVAARRGHAKIRVLERVGNTKGSALENHREITRRKKLVLQGTRNVKEKPPGTRGGDCPGGENPWGQVNITENIRQMVL